MIFVDRILPLRTLQLDGDFHLWLIDLEVFPVGLKALRQNLHAQLTVRNALGARLPFLIRLQLKPSPPLLSARVHGMHDDCGTAHRPAIVLLENQETHDGCRLVDIPLCTGRSGNYEGDQQDTHSCNLSHRMSFYAAVASAV